MNNTVFHKSLSQLFAPWTDPEWLYEYINTSMLPAPSPSWRLNKILKYESIYNMTSESMYKLYQYDEFELGRTGITREELSDWIEQWIMYR